MGNQSMNNFLRPNYKFGGGIFHSIIKSFGFVIRMTGKKHFQKKRPSFERAVFSFYSEGLLLLNIRQFKSKTFFLIHSF